MKTIVTKEFIKLLKDKRFRTILFNFTDNVIRMVFEERSKFTGVETRTFYHIKAEPSRYVNQTGLSRIEHYYISPILAVIKPGDVLYMAIETNGTEQLRKVGFEWQFTKIRCERNSKFICDWNMDNELMEAGCRYLPSNNCIEWNETRFNEFVTY